VLSRKHCFAYSMGDLVGYKGGMGSFKIELTTDDSIFTRPRRYAPIEIEIQNEKCTELLQYNIIAPAPLTTIYAAPCVIPAKKDVNGQWTDRRFCVDYRRINTVTKADNYGMHMADQLFQAVGSSNFFSKVDLRSGFHQIPIYERDQVKTSFWWNNKLYVYTKCPYGLKCCPAFFQRVMDFEICAAGLQDFALSFIDDLLIHSLTASDHIKHVTAVLDMLHNCGLRAHPEKSIFGACVVEYLGHNISRYGLTPHEAKVSAIAGLRTPSNVSELRSVLGFLNYYRCYIPHYSSIAAPLNVLLQLNVTWKWGPDQLSAFQQLKDLLCQEGLALKRCDPGKPLLLYTDWSCNGIGAVLAQIDDNQDEYMVACISRSLNKHEKNYSSYEGEMLACVWAIKTLRSFLYGVKFTVVTDHQPLTWLMSTQELSGKHARWALSLMDYDFVIQHRPGQLHQNADVPSRFPRANSNDGTGARLDPDAVDLSLASPTSPSSSFRSVLMSAIDSAQYEAFVQPTASASFMDDYAPTSDQMLAGHVGRLSDYIDAYSLDSAEAIGVPTGVVVPPPSSTEGSVPTNDGPPALTSEEQADRFLANLPALSAAAPTAAAVLTGKPDSHGVRPTHSLDTRIVPDFFTHAFAEGITVMDLFGGLCPGLDAVLRSGIQVKRYIYCDVHPPAQAVAMHRINILKGQYPHLLPHTAVANALTTVPHDARRIFTEELLQANALDGTQWLIIAGWDCAGFSSAGRQKGLHDTRSHTFFDALRIIGTLQQLQTNIPPAYILENSAIQFNFQNTNLRQYTFSYICDRIGTPVAVDAARFNSYAHRLRNFWSNLADAHLLHDILSSMHRQPGRLVNHILDPNCTAQLVSKSDRAPFYICNLKNRDMCALPTLVAYTNSRAFTVGKPGMIWDGIIKSYREPNVSERERALGYSTGATAAPGLSDVDRHQITGRCIDAFTLHAIFAALKALHLFAPHLPTQPQLVSACATVTPRHMLPPLSIPALLQHPAAGILMRHGWVPGQPLTSTRTGISLTSPLHLPHNRNRHGLGYAATVTELGGV
jgi:hypothetical protein